MSAKIPGVNTARPVFVLAALLAVFLPLRAGALPSDRVASAIASWDARGLRAALEAAEPSGRGRALYAWGWLHLLEGDYARAEDAFARSPEHNAPALAAVARGSRDAVRDAARAVSASGRFVAWYRPGPDEAMLPYVFEAADAQWDVLATRFAMTVPAPVRIEIVPDFETLSAATGLPLADVRASGAVAVCRHGRMVVVSPAALPYGYPYADTVAHELVHFFLTVRSGDTLPVWFQEASAKYLEAAWRGDPGLLSRSVRNLLAEAAATGRLIPFDSMRGSLARLTRVEDTALAFAELSMFAGYLERVAGTGVLVRLADELRSGDDAMALLRVTGRSLADLEAEWARTLPRETDPARPGRVVLLREAPPPEELPPEARAAVRLGDELRAQGRPRAAAIQYRKAVTGPDANPAVIARLAAALNEAGQPLEALTDLSEAGLDEAEFPPLARERGRALAALGRFEEAEGPLLASVRADPYDPEAHRALEKTAAALGRTAIAEREHRLESMWR